MAGILDRAVQREPLVDHGGESGATLERVILDDGTRLIVKRLSPEQDLGMQASDDTLGRAGYLWASGALRDLPDIIDDPIVEAWKDDGTWMLAMRDVSDALIADDRVLDADECHLLVSALTAMHAAYVGAGIDGLCSLPVRLGLMGPASMRRVDPDAPLPTWVLQGWDAFAEVCPDDVAVPVLRFMNDAAELAAELGRAEQTLLHGDYWTRNLGLSDGRVVVLDWGLATAGPGALDFALFLGDSAWQLGVPHNDVVAMYRSACGAAYDEPTLRLALLWGLGEIGWNIAYHAARNPDNDVRDREQQRLAWWVDRAREGLEVWSPS